MKQILIVEDDSFLNKMVAYNLTADGYGVTSALNARTAADAIRQREFDLVLLDINLPDGNFITAKGLGVALELGLEIITNLVDEETSDHVADTIQFN